MTTSIAKGRHLSYFEDMGDWKQVGENLVQHRGGTIYLRAKVKGKVIRESLDTDDLRIAKLKRDPLLIQKRAAAAATKEASTGRTLGEAIETIGKRIENDPTLRPDTIVFYQDIVSVLNRTLPVAIHGRTWTAGEASAWWKKIAAQYAPQRANSCLMVAKRVGKLLVESGIRLDDPTAKLKRVKIPKKHLNLPTREQIDSIIQSIRDQKKANSEESANMVAFLAFAGCRHGQAIAFEWKHVEKDWLIFPSGIRGTKGADTRRLPISPPLRALLKRMRKKGSTGPLFKVSRPREALNGATERLGLTHIRIHDLRHFFATHALECGVDVPTVSKWLGHKDGGVLVLKTYGHLRDEHSLASAAKLK